MDKVEKLKAAWALYFSKNNISPITNKSIYSCHITTNETVFCYYQLAQKKDLVVTDAAIYFEKVRWSLSNICKFAVYQSKEKIYLINAAGVSYSLAFSENSGAEKFFKLIISMQEYWLFAATNGSNQRQELFNYANSSLKSAITNSISATEEILYISQFLLKYSGFKIEIGLTLIEYKLTRGDFDSILRCASTLSLELDDSTILQYIDSLIKKHSPSNVIFNEAHVQNANQSNLTKQIATMFSTYATQSNLKDKISSNSIRSYSDLLKSIGNCSTLDIDNYIKQWYKIAAPTITVARESISSQSTLNSTTLTTVDNYGMYLFNYAILYNNKNVISQFDKLNLVGLVPGDTSSPINALFDPLFIAFYRNDTDTFNYLITRSSDFAALGKTLATIREKISSEKNSSSTPFDHSESIMILNQIKAQENYIAKLKATRSKNKISWHTIRAEEEKAIALQERYRQVLARENRLAHDKSHNRYSQLKEEEQSVIDEIERLKNYYKSKYTRYSEYFNSSEDAFINMMLHSYLHPDEFCKQGHIDCSMLVYFCNIPFLVNQKYFSKFTNIHKQREDSSQKASGEHNSNAEHKQDRTTHHQNKQQHSSNTNEHRKTQSTFKKESKVSDVKKPFGNSWFSPDAHKDLSALKHEYRKLILIYHPDSPQGSAEIFIDIQNERNSIISKIGR